MPEFAFELSASGDEADGLQNAVVGLDVTYAHTDETATRTWTTGAEVLLLSGDIGADVDDQGTPGNPADDTILVVDDDVLGFYAFVDRGWTRYQSAGLQVGWAELPRSAGHAFYDRLQAVLVEAGFDGFAETRCAPFYASRQGRPSLPPGRYFRMHLVGYFEGIDSERGLEWRCADSLSLREFLRLGLSEPVPDHSRLTRTLAATVRSA